MFVPSRMAFHATGASCYLKADLFYLEVVLLPCGEVEDVRMAWHGRSPVVCKCIICGMKCAAQVIIRDSVAAKRMAAAAPQVRGLLTTPRSATSNSYQLPGFFFLFSFFYLLPQRARNFSVFSVKLANLFSQCNIPGEKYPTSHQPLNLSLV